MVVCIMSSIKKTFFFSNVLDETKFGSLYKIVLHQTWCLQLNRRGLRLRVKSGAGPGGVNGVEWVRGGVNIKPLSAGRSS